jgi:hypothetical protein
VGFLAFFFLWHATAAEGLTSAELDRRIEAFLDARVDGRIDFEVGDSLAKLEWLQVAERDDSGRWHAVPIEQAIEALASRWTEVPG